MFFFDILLASVPLFCNTNRIFLFDFRIGTNIMSRSNHKVPYIVAGSSYFLSSGLWKLRIRLIIAAAYSFRNSCDPKVIDLGINLSAV